MRWLMKSHTPGAARRTNPWVTSSRAEPMVNEPKTLGKRRWLWFVDGHLIVEMGTLLLMVIRRVCCLVSTNLDGSLVAATEDDLTFSPRANFEVWAKLFGVQIRYQLTAVLFDRMMAMIGRQDGRWRTIGGR